MKYVFVDMDGVISEYGYPSGLYDGEFQKGNFLGKKPVKPVIEEILKKYDLENFIIMICSSTASTKEILEKNEWLNFNFGVPYENRIFIRSDENKVDIIKYYIEDILYGNVQEHAILIDDKGSVLREAKKLGMECYHPTQLLAAKSEQENNPSEESNIPIEEISEEVGLNNIEEPAPVVEEEVLDNGEMLNNNESINEEISEEELKQGMKTIGEIINEQNNNIEEMFGGNQ